MLPPDRRLRDNRDFRRIYAKGRFFAHPLAVLHLLKRRGESAEKFPESRIGFVISKKQGKAVVRNRIKRRLREAIRLQLSELKTGSYDLVFVGRTAAYEASWEELNFAISDLLQRAGVLIDPVRDASFDKSQLQSLKIEEK